MTSSSLPIDITIEALKEGKLILVLSDNWYLLISLSILIIFLCMNRKNIKYGDQKNDYIPELDPIELGFLLNMDQDLKRGYTKMISAEIILLAMKGYLTIEKLSEKNSIFESDRYVLIKNKEIDDQLTEYHKDIINRIFHSNKTKVTLDEIKKEAHLLNSLPEDQSEKEKIVNQSLTLYFLFEISEKVTKELEAKDYLTNNSHFKYYFGVLIKGLMFIPIVLIPFFLSTIYPLIMLSAILGIPMFLILFFFSNNSQRFTLKGLREKDRFNNLRYKIDNDIDIMKDKTNFELMLPYSIITDSLNYLAKAFNGFDYYQEWYRGTNSNNLNTMMIISDIDNFKKELDTAIFGPIRK
ncbi:MAG: DUF2207 domain-containing protein [Candidatus Pacebacteria bacterium]|nr:DUF2207 domain-containing protein [Candidatus Paceibacterota bacterium]